MAIVTLNKDEVKKIVGNLNDENLDNTLSIFGIGVEEINENTISAEITPNRPDMLSPIGLLRALESYFGKKLSSRGYKIKPSGLRIIVDKSVEKIRPYSMAAIVKNVKLTNERVIDIMQWQEKMHMTLGRNRKKVALGYYVLNKIKFPIVYKADDPQKIIFEPLDMSEKMNGLQILQRHPTGRAYAKQLEGFDKYPVYIDSAGEVLSMPPIINSNNSGKLTPEKQDILVECSGSELELLKKVISMAVCDLIDLGGEAYSIEIVYGNKKESIDLKPEKMKVSIENINKLLGLDLKEIEVKKLFNKMGLEYQKGHAHIPPYRTDMMHEVDLIEDIAIAYGYDKFDPEIPKIATIGEENKKEILNRRITDILAGLGLIETSTLHLITREDFKKSGMKEVIEVEDSKSDYRLLRPNLINQVLKTLSENIDAEYPQKIFEIGRVFKKDEKEETGIREENHLVISLSPGNFTEIKQITEYLARMLGKKFEIKETINQNFIEGRCGRIILEDKDIGILGEIHPQTLKNWKIKMPVVLLELSIDEL
jgi:phenylalanyl-tRNA synthetase beta chain